MRALLLIIAAASILTGCVTYDTQRFDMGERKILIVCKDIDDILGDHQSVDGFTMAHNTTIGDLTIITVPWTLLKDANGKPQPDFYLLGHELWHCPELGGNFHN